MTERTKLIILSCCVAAIMPAVLCCCFPASDVAKDVSKTEGQKAEKPEVADKKVEATKSPSVSSKAGILG